VCKARRYKDFFIFFPISFLEALKVNLPSNSSEIGV
jgi:hypothetical protein